MLVLIEYAIKYLISLVDGIIYWADAELYDLMLDIASAKIFDKEIINTVAARVYQLLALVMLFRLIFAFLSYIIEPNDMTDKNKGFGNIIKKIIITLFLIVITPFCFDLSRSLQETIIKDKVIEYFVFGQVKPTNASAGYNMMHTVGTMFVTPYKCEDSCVAKNNKGKKCDTDWYKNLPIREGTNGPELTKKSFSVGECAYGIVTSDGNITNYGINLYNASKVDGIDDEQNIRTLLSLGAATRTEDKFLIGAVPVELLTHYQFLISTGVGIFIGYMLIIMCIDVAVRSIKLSFYEIIAPVPIISYIGPKDGKDTMLNKWFSETLKTYADLFTRIAGLQLAVFFINEILDGPLVLNGDGVANTIFVNIFLVLGALTFAKSLPKILEGMGIKFSGGGFNLKKKFTDDMVGGKRLVQAASAVASAASGLAGNTAMAAGRLASGGLVAGATGFKNAITGKGWHTNGTFRRSAQAAGARMMASGKATGGRLWKGAVLGQDYQAKVGEDAGKYRENMRTSNANVETIGSYLTSGSAAEQAQKFNVAFGNAAGRLNVARNAAKTDLKAAQATLITAETAYKAAPSAATLAALTTAQADVKTYESQVAAIDKQMKRAIEHGPNGKRRMQEYEAYKEYKDLHP